MWPHSRSEIRPTGLTSAPAPRAHKGGGGSSQPGPLQTDGPVARLASPRPSPRPLLLRDSLRGSRGPPLPGTVPHAGHGQSAGASGPPGPPSACVRAWRFLQGRCSEAAAPAAAAPSPALPAGLPRVLGVCPTDDLLGISRCSLFTHSLCGPPGLSFGLKSDFDLHFLGGLS